MKTWECIALEAILMAALAWALAVLAVALCGKALIIWWSSR